jgi:hypothetical protein
VKRADFVDPVLAAIVHHGGRATIVQIAKYIWDNYEPRLRSSGDVFYTWQYEMRWAGDELVKLGKIVKHKTVPGIWEAI